MKLSPFANIAHLPGAQKFLRLAAMPGKTNSRREVEAYAYCNALDEDALLELAAAEDFYVRSAVAANLQVRGTEKTLARMLGLCTDAGYKARATSAAVLGFLDISDQETLEGVINLLAYFALHDASAEVRCAAIWSLGSRYRMKYAHRAFIVSVLARTARDSRASIRFATSRALGIGGVRSTQTIPLVEKLLRDPAKKVRDWTAFHVYSSCLDSAGIREGLAAMLDDACEDARLEAVRSLARLRDRRALPALRQELDPGNDSIWDMMVEAAADLGDASLIPLLEDWQGALPGDTKTKRIIKRSLTILRRKAALSKRGKEAEKSAPA